MMDFARAGMQLDDFLSSLPGLGGGHLTVCQRSQCHTIPMNFVLLRGKNHLE